MKKYVVEIHLRRKRKTLRYLKVHSTFEITLIKNYLDATRMEEAVAEIVSNHFWSEYWDERAYHLRELKEIKERTKK